MNYQFCLTGNDDKAQPCQCQTSRHWSKGWWMQNAETLQSWDRVDCFQMSYEISRTNLFSIMNMSSIWVTKTVIIKLVRPSDFHKFKYLVS
jgi:hypothetical protein